MSMANPQQDKVTLSPDELALLNRCKREAYVFKAIPLGAVTSLGYFYSLKFGRLASASRRSRILIGSAIFPVCVLYASFSAYSSFFRELKTLEHSPLLETMRKNMKDKKDANPNVDDTLFSPNEAMQSVFSKQPASNDVFSNEGDVSRQQRPSHSLFSESHESRTSAGDFFNETAYRPPPLEPSPLPTEDRELERPARFLSYKERREFYRKNPKLEARLDPYGKEQAPPPPPNSF